MKTEFEAYVGRRRPDLDLTRGRRGDYESPRTRRAWAKWEALATEARDAARWRELVKHIWGVRYESLGIQAFQIRGLLPSLGVNILQGSVAEHFTKTVDAAIAARGETK